MTVTASHESSACVIQLLPCNASLQASVQAVPSSCKAASSEEVSRLCDLLHVVCRESNLIVFMAWPQLQHALHHSGSVHCTGVPVAA